MQHIIRSREASEQQAASTSPTRNHILASSLAQLLDERKYASTQAELATLVSRYAMDVDVLERLAGTVNIPSIDDDTRQRVIGNDGDERFTVVVSEHALCYATVVNVFLQAKWTDRHKIDE